MVCCPWELMEPLPYLSGLFTVQYPFDKVNSSHGVLPMRINGTFTLFVWSVYCAISFDFWRKRRIKNFVWEVCRSHFVGLFLRLTVCNMFLSALDLDNYRTNFISPITRRQILDFQTERDCLQRPISNLMEMEESYPNRYKTLWEKEKLLVTSNFSYSNSVFKWLVYQGRQKVSLCGNGLNF